MHSLFSLPYDQNLGAMTWPAFQPDRAPGGLTALTDDAQIQMVRRDAARLGASACVAHPQFYPVSRLSVNASRGGGTAVVS
jgi:hypothetical protein